MIYLGIFGYLLLFFYGVHSHVKVGMENAHEDIISSYDLQFWVLQK
jgi:succinate dehydrogenase hydrophobic anchor subunit